MPGCGPPAVRLMAKVGMKDQEYLTQERWILRVCSRKERGAALAGVIYPVPTQREHRTMGDSPLPTRRQPDKEGKCGKIASTLPTTRLLDVPTIAWPSSSSLLDDLIRWSAQRLDHQINLIRSISADISNHAAGTCGAKRHRFGQGHRAGLAKSAAGCPKPWLGTARSSNRPWLYQGQ
jgi:hypothetical protein